MGEGAPRRPIVKASITTSALPSGAATEAKQDTGNTSLSSIDGKTPSLSSGRVPVESSQQGTWTVQPGNTANTSPWLASIHDGTTKATVRDLGSNDALNVALVDGSGNQVTSFGGGTQYTEGDVDSTITGTAMLMETGGDTLVPVQGTLSGGMLVDLGPNNDVAVSSSALPTGAATAALQTQPGVDIGDVTVNNASGASAVNIQDGGNSITVDGTVSATQSGSWSSTVTQSTASSLNAQVVGNVASFSADSGNPVLVAGHFYSGAIPAPTDGDRVSLRVDSSSRLFTTAAQSGTWNITNISGTVSLPTGAATEATLNDLTVTPATATGSEEGEVSRLKKALALRERGEVLSDVEQEILALHDKLQIAVEALKKCRDLPMPLFIDGVNISAAALEKIRGKA